jgi:uncharacterized membrane protein YcgQ (UPF0703/DUF1980 family)
MFVVHIEYMLQKHAIDASHFFDNYRRIFFYIIFLYALCKLCVIPKKKKKKRKVPIRVGL